ncbi:MULTISPECIES: hypothetical protein [Paenibacillus]|uniref:Uncharacterized protein n=1 Tax=Paenibacillus polymyxa TaxID=1406 RepID=A0ABX2ZAB7_PAEPO|nr:MULTISPECIES: hypothetical protein [Paenibacillus]ODA07382.1 hypothetical protein A7312_09850 [Paenibacillus polymyxa]OME69598.1 hypothetical protein BK119_14085 [Paenibacillus peoriae]
MSDNQILNITLPFLFIFLLVIYVSTRLFMFKNRKILNKIIFRYFIISLITCLLFSFIYLFIFIGDLQEIGGDNLNPLKLKHVFFENSNQYSENKYLILSDVFFYSASVYFQFPSNVQFSGLAQIVILTERFLGNIIPIILICQTIMEMRSQKNNYQLLQIFLNRGWNILRIRDSYYGKSKALEIIDSNMTIKPLFVENIEEIQDELKYFKVNWNNADKELLPYFLKVLEEPLRDKDVELSLESLQLFYSRDTDNKKYYVQYYEFLKKIENHIFTNESIFGDFNIVLDELKHINKNMIDQSSSHSEELADE